MAMGVPRFFCFFFFFLLFPILAQSQSQPTNFIFEGFTGRGSDLSLDSGATIKPSGLLRLTNRSNNAIGHAFYVKPIEIFDKNSSSSFSAENSYSFSTTFVFEIVPLSSGHGGYGLAFLLAPSTQLTGADSGQYLGILNSGNDGNESNHIIMVEFDTVNGFNGDFEEDGNHVGIGINTMNSNKVEPASYHRGKTDQKEDMSLEGSDPIQAWIEYDGEEKVLNVTICYAGKPKPVKPLITYSGLILTDYFKETMYVGFSASTGEYRSSSHYVTGWSFSLNGEAQKLNVSALPRAPKEKESAPYNAQTIALISSLCIVTLLLLGTLVFFLFYKRSSTSEILEDWEIDCPHRFRYKDLHEGTKGFRESELIGVGGFGSVYRGVLPSNGNEVAVKKITRNSVQGMREFAAEIESLGRLRHKNLVNLQGWCKQKNDLLLVYEYIPNGSLDSLLFKPKNGFVLSWEQRFNIVKGVAAGLLYLHEEWEKVVIHRDVKPSNVLIDAEMNARLGDFGLARLYDHGEMSHTTNVVGTIGYIAPELTRTGKASASSDVYAYGILLLVVATGQRPIGSGTFLLMEWVRECQQLGRILEAVDPLLNSVYVVEEMELVLKLGLLCSHPNPELRPTMRQVMRYLSGEELQWSSIDSQQGYEFSSRYMEIISSDTYKMSHASSSNVGLSSSSIEIGR